VSHVFHLRYKLDFESGEFSKSEIAEGFGAADALMICSISYPEDGSYSMVPLSRDGRTNQELTAKEMFKAWILLGQHIAQMDDLDEGRKLIAETPFQMMREFILSQRSKEN
jgi:hypothetical protein